MKITTKVKLKRESHGRKAMAPVLATEATVEQGRIPRVTKLMALAIKFDQSGMAWWPIRRSLPGWGMFPEPG